MSNLRKLMAFRENITHFKQDQLPEKAIIEKRAKVLTLK